MATLTPQSSFALLLATSSWDELRSLVEVGTLFRCSSLLTNIRRRITLLTNGTKLLFQKSLSSAVRRLQPESKCHGSLTGVTF